jgi:hypothetical protein
LNLKHWSWIAGIFLIIAMAAAFTSLDLLKTIETYRFGRTVEAKILKIYQPRTESPKGTTAVYADLLIDEGSAPVTTDAFPAMHAGDRIKVRVFNGQVRPLVNGQPNNLLIMQDVLVPLGFVILFAGLACLLFGEYKSVVFRLGKWLCWISLWTWISFGMLSIYRLASLGHGHSSFAPQLITMLAVVLASKVLLGAPLHDA